MDVQRYPVRPDHRRARWGQEGRDHSEHRRGQQRQRLFPAAGDLCGHRLQRGHRAGKPGIESVTLTNDLSLKRNYNTITWALSRARRLPHLQGREQPAPTATSERPISLPSATTISVPTLARVRPSAITRSPAAGDYPATITFHEQRACGAGRPTARTGSGFRARPITRTWTFPARRGPMIHFPSAWSRTRSIRSTSSSVEAGLGGSDQPQHLRRPGIERGLYLRLSTAEGEAGDQPRRRGSIPSRSTM
jgi:hypothetical protein